MWTGRGAGQGRAQKGAELWTGPGCRVGHKMGLKCGRDGVMGKDMAYDGLFSTSNLHVE
jgi:hypothetical protein